jgi:acyl carrier protein
MQSFSEINEFIQFLQEELQLDKEEINAHSEFRKLRTWSSLNALIIISRINDESNVLVSGSDLATCTTVADLHQFIINQSNGTN